ncbi:hypothetical protein ACFO0O_17415 [Cobetia amphilecti]|uniref:Uncharacterized protein n=1 Tax=Cobetia amphilecti TaxID=1055104 RepID=A0ABT6USK2_9GAMM|nr:hypothetical protein [Cobetia amphilecti]MDI5885028.1 hypothetical protein [Cobetia amphilecti]WOI24843.1 hypothetical protein R1T44_11895 [Cobetia amphilecti]|tara:strand:+ start:269 stop:481 length:213 start_codon:yes stop_codon:yes gene_type:complete
MLDFQRFMLARHQTSTSLASIGIADRAIANIAIALRYVPSAIRSKVKQVPCHAEDRLAQRLPQVVTQQSQ